ncbi:restriction endonuclease [bacterium 336/3]|nr:restriction endonuclease [bacterium 336/3]
MDFKDEIKALGDRILSLKEQVSTEEATKTAFILPFLQKLGYDVFNPLEITAELVADIGIKKGEKVDYAILKDGKPSVIIECKSWKEKLDVHTTQLHRYFHVTEARFGVLTNGIIYKFYTDLEAPNKMDENPFLEIDITSFTELQVNELKKFHKSYFNLEEILTSASDLKYTNQLKNLLKKEMVESSADFVKFFTKQIYSGVVTQKVIDQFTSIVKKTFQQIISETVNLRLNQAVIKETETLQIAEIPKLDVQQNGDDEASKIITTEEELESFYIIKAILRVKIDSNRIFYRDTQSYFGILLDNNNRKPICRLHLNGSKKYLSLFDGEGRSERKIEIRTIDDVYQYAEILITTALSY